MKDENDYDLSCHSPNSRRIQTETTCIDRYNNAFWRSTRAVSNLGLVDTELRYEARGTYRTGRLKFNVTPCTDPEHCRLQKIGLPSLEVAALSPS